MRFQIVPKGGFFERSRALARVACSFLPSLSSQPKAVVIVAGPHSFEPVEVKRVGEHEHESIGVHQVRCGLSFELYITC